jgi:fatty acid desaturase
MTTRSFVTHYNKNVYAKRPPSLCTPPPLCYTTNTMKLFRFKEDRVPVLCIALIFCGDAVVWFFATNPLIPVIWLFLTLWPKIFICSWNHHHQHLPTFYAVPLNRLLEFMYALHTGITTNAWVLHHNLGHHLNYLDQSRDESGWKRADGKVMGEWEYTFKIALTGYWRAFKVGLNYPKYRSSFLGMGLFVAMVIGALLYVNWFNTVLVFVLPMTLGYLTTCWHTYSHHAGLDTDDPFHASHNIMHRWYNICTGNLGYHTAHHVKPGLHWSRLPEFHATIADQIPTHLFVGPPIPFKWFPHGSAPPTTPKMAHPEVR